MKTCRSSPWCFAFKNRKGEVTGHFFLEFLKYISGYRIDKFCLGAVAAYSQTASIALLKMYLVYILEQFECSQYICWFTIRDTVCSRSGASVIISVKQRSYLQVVCLLLWNFPLQNCVQSLPRGRGKNKVTYRIIPMLFHILCPAFSFLF